MLPETKIEAVIRKGFTMILLNEYFPQCLYQQQSTYHSEQRFLAILESRLY